MPSPRTGGDDVGRVAVQAAAGTVVPHGGARIGMGGGFLHVPHWDPGVQCSGNEASCGLVANNTSWWTAAW
jgi:hypothetical protein